MADDTGGVGATIALLLMVGVGVTWCAMGGPDEVAAKAAVEAWGFTNVAIGQPAFFGCGQDDVQRLPFTATDVKGHAVKGIACAGMFFKQWTIRLDPSPPLPEAQGE